MINPVPLVYKKTYEFLFISEYSNSFIFNATDYLQMKYKKDLKTLGCKIQGLKNLSQWLYYQSCSEQKIRGGKKSERPKNIFCAKENLAASKKSS